MMVQETQAGRPTYGQFRFVAAQMLDWVKRCVERARQRHALAELDDRLLQDVGLSRADVTSEVEKPFWQI
jgi:uncharacterized protein YjiS (DUF1127 family)